MKRNCGSTAFQGSCSCISTRTFSTSSMNCNLKDLGRLFHRPVYDVAKTSSTGALTTLSTSTFTHTTYTSQAAHTKDPPRSSNRWNTLLPHHGGRQLRESFTELSHMRSNYTLATVTAASTPRNGIKHHRNTGSRPQAKLAFQCSSAFPNRT